MIDVRRLRLLLELSRRGTITAVADALAYTPSAVSQQLAALEREAGVPLLERVGRRVALTPAGAVLPLALVTLGRAHPALELMVTELDPVAVPGALHAGMLDVALTFVYDYVPAEPDPALDTEPLLEETVYLATASGQSDPAEAGIQADPAETGIQDWRDAPWIAGSPGTLCHTMLIRACQASGFTPRIRHHADDFATVLALVAAGQGVSLIPELGVAETPPGVALTPLTSRRRTSIGCRKGTRHHPAVSAFAAAIREQSRVLSAGTSPGSSARGHGLVHRHGQRLVR